MANLQILIDNIRSALAHSEFTNPDVIRGYASEYAAECVKLNDRVKQCVPFLHSGNLAEAVRLAEAPPNIVDTYTLLDFEGRGDWVEIADGLGFEVPPSLPTEQMTQLNDAYVQVAPLDNLLKQHRYHALNGSALQEKLAVLRKIAKADTNNFFWSEDQEKFEKVRLAELGKEVQQAVSAKNDYQVRVLYNELTDPNWRITPPPQYRTTLCTAILQGYTETLLNHFNTFDYDHTAETYQQMQSICRTNGMAMPQALEIQIRPAVQWLQETAKQNNADSSYQNACEELRVSLDDETPQRELENLFYALQNAATQAGQNIPPDLIQHYELRISTLERKATMRRRVIIIATLGVCLLFAVLIGVGLRYQFHNSEIANALIVLLAIEKENRIDDIEKTIERLEKDKPAIAQSPDVAAVIARLQTMANQDKERAKNFERFYNNADAALDSNPEYEELQGVKTSIDEAAKLERTDSEKGKITEINGKYSRQRIQRQREIDTVFGEQLAKISQEYDALPNSGETSVLKETVTKIGNLRKQLRELLEKSQNISAEQKQEGKHLMSSMSERETKLGKAVEEYNAFQRVLDTKPGRSDFKTVLKTFADKYPSHPAAYDIQTLVKEYDDVQAVAASIQNLYTETSGLKDYAEWQSKAPVLKTQCDALADKITAPIGEIFKPIAGLALLAQTEPLSDKTFTESKKILGMLAQKELFSFIDGTGKWYYLLTKPEKGKKSFYVATFAAAGNVHTNSIRDEDIERNTGRNGTQFAFAKEALKILNKTNDAAFAGEEVCSIWQRMFSEDYNALDPILRCVLIDLLYTDYAKADPVFASVFKRYDGIVKDSGVDLMTNWMDVEARSTAGERGKASTALENLPDLETLTKDWKTKTNNFTKTLSEYHPQWECIGILIKQDGTWQCKESNRPAVKKGKLYTFRQLGEKVQLNQIGSCDDEKIRITAASAASCLQCLPVYLMSEQ